LVSGRLRWRGRRGVSVAIAGGGPSPVRPPALATDRVKTVVAPDAFGWEIEIVIEARGYVSAQQFASKSRISRKTLSRRIATGKVPPMIKIGKKLFFEVSGIRGGPASDESDPATNNEVR
jgi:predicted DNA-binding transcriptional regulator AlpA